MLIKSIFFFSFLVSAFCSFGQLAQTERFEIELNDGQRDPYHVASLKTEGLFLYGQQVGDGSNFLAVMRIDTMLQQVWSGFINLDRGMSLVSAQTTEKDVFILLKNRYAGEFLIVKLEIEHGNYVAYTVSNLIPFNPTHFVVMKEGALIGGYFNYRPIILHYSFKTQQAKILPGFFNELGEIDQIQVNDENVDVIVSAKNYEKKNCLWIRNYSAAGELNKTIVLTPDVDKNLIYGRSIQSPNGDQVVCGVYGRYTDYSRGVFIATINPYGEYHVNYYNFADLQRFFNYMKASREKRLKERIERRKIKGKKIRLNYRIMVSNIIPNGDQFLMLGEAFYPHYTYATNSRTNAALFANRTYGTPFSRGDLVFDGYQYTHAVVIGFDKAGNLTWDNSFEINDVRTFQLEHFVKILPEKERMVLLYLFNNTIRTKIIKKADIVEGKAFDALKMKFTDDVVTDTDTESSHLDYWYRNVCFATGVQRIRNMHDPGVSFHRRVFFINRIDYK